MLATTLSNNFYNYYYVYHDIMIIIMIVYRPTEEEYSVITDSVAISIVTDVSLNRL